MKHKWDSKYFKAGLTAFLVITAGLFVFYLLFFGKEFKLFSRGIMAVLMPVLDGMIIAYLLAPIVNSLEKKVIYPLLAKCRKPDAVKHPKTKQMVRAVSMILTFIIVFFLIYQFFALVIPQIVSSIRSIVIQFPAYVSQIGLWVERLLQDNPDMEQFAINMLDRYSETLQSWMNTKLLPQMNSLVMSLSLSVISVLKAIWNLVIGFIISIYLIVSKEMFSAQIKKILYAVFDRRTANVVIHDLRFTHRTFSGFISGKIIDSIIIGILCFVCISLMEMPYAVLISVIVGVTNVIPFFGPYFGAVPSAFLILLIDPVKCIYFLIFILVLQQFDGNILGPKILGNSTGLSSFWVIFSITLFGGLWGVAGMILGVPLFAVVYAGVRANVHRQLKRKKLPINTENYLTVGSINRDGVMRDMTNDSTVTNHPAPENDFQWNDAEEAPDPESNATHKPVPPQEDVSKEE